MSKIIIDKNVYRECFGELQQVVPINFSKFTKKELEKLESYRQRACALKILYAYSVEQYRKAETKENKEEWSKALKLNDKLKNKLDSEMFKELPQLPDAAIRIFF